jgi:hypothetical protein
MQVRACGEKHDTGGLILVLLHGPYMAHIAAATPDLPLLYPTLARPRSSARSIMPNVEHKLGVQVFKKERSNT